MNNSTGQFLSVLLAFSSPPKTRLIYCSAKYNFGAKQPASAIASGLKT